MATNLQRFAFTSSYGSRRFAICDRWTQTSVAGNAVRQWLLIAVLSHVVLYGVKRSMSEKDALLPTKRIFCNYCRNMGHFFCGVERVKRFVNVHLHCIISNLKRISKMSTCPPWKNFCGRLCKRVQNRNQSSFETSVFKNFMVMHPILNVGRRSGELQEIWLRLWIGEYGKKLQLTLLTLRILIHKFLTL